MTNWAASLPIFRWHERGVHVPRVQQLEKAITRLVPHAPSMLDIGCGDGTLARKIAARVGALADLRGVDIMVRPNAVIPVQQYNGTHLPFDDRRFDLVTICDVLHHADDPSVVVREALRVLTPTGSLVIKDHFAFGPLSKGILWLMDIIGNFAPGVPVPAKYLSPPEWVSLITEVGGTIQTLVWPLEIHALPWRSIARSEYQFLMRVACR